MQLTRERKVYAAFLAAALAALAADKFILGPPESSAAVRSDYLVNSPAAPPAARKTVAVEAAPPPLPSPAAPALLAQRMEQVARDQQLNLDEAHDVFHTPATWVKPAAPAQPDLQAAFAAKHRLVALLKSSRGGIAVVAGQSRKSLRIGQQMDGFTLVSIAERSAAFRSGSVAVELQLIDDPQLESQSITPSGR